MAAKGLSSESNTAKHGRTAQGLAPPSADTVYERMQGRWCPRSSLVVSFCLNSCRTELLSMNQSDLILLIEISATDEKWQVEKIEALHVPQGQYHLPHFCIAPFAHAFKIYL
jgi:hypothetical protein